MILFISGPEIGFIIFIVVLLFGADKIPDFARNLGKGINSIKHATNEIKQEIKNFSRKLKLHRSFTPLQKIRTHLIRTESEKAGT